MGADGGFGHDRLRDRERRSARWGGWLGRRGRRLEGGCRWCRTLGFGEMEDVGWVYQGVGFHETVLLGW